MKTILLLAILAWAINSSAQIVNIPDTNFKAALVDDADINTNSDTEIQTSEAAAYTGGISVNYLGISDLTGIEAFTALTVLYCNNNQLTSLNVSANTALIYLNCSLNQLTSLDVSSNTALIELICGYNQLTSLNVSANSVLTDLDCYNNQLTSLNVSAATALTHLNCDNNQLTSLNISSNMDLIELICGNNQLTSLNVTANTNLFHFYCNNNQLTNLNVSSNTGLTILDCYNNQLASLNFSADTFLTGLDCSYNQLTSLNIKNGFNSNLAYFVATNNPNLTCIQVDDSAYMNANWANGKDVIASYSENCAVGVNELQVADDGLQIYPNPSSGKFFIQGTRADGQRISIKIYNMLGKIIYNSFIHLSNNSILDLSNQPDGIYFVNVKSENNIYTQKLLKQ